MLKLLEVMPDLRAVRGVGDVAMHDLCVLAMCAAEDRLRRGEPIGEATDQVECVSPVLRVLAIARNDAAWESDAARTEWALALVPRLLGSRDDARDVRRAAAVARYAVRVIAAAAMRAAGLGYAADRLAALPEDVPLDVAWAAAQEAEAAARVAEAAARETDAAAGAVWEDAARAAREAWATVWDVSESAEAQAWVAWEATKAARASAASAVSAAARAARAAAAREAEVKAAARAAWKALSAARAAAQKAAALATKAARASAAAANGSASLDELLRIALETE